MPLDKEYWHSNKLDGADYQAEQGTEVARVSLDNALILILQVDHRHEEEYKEGAIDERQRSVEEALVKSILREVSCFRPAFWTGPNQDIDR